MVAPSCEVQPTAFYTTEPLALFSHKIHIPFSYKTMQWHSMLPKMLPECWIINFACLYLFFCKLIAADTYCIVKCGRQRVRSSIVHESHSPQWDLDAVFFRYDVLEPIIVEVGHLLFFYMIWLTTAAVYRIFLIPFRFENIVFSRINSWAVLPLHRRLTMSK